ncbi:helix-turn-helix transcriptional regulator [Janthinobacterium sp.]|uniref:helix-turn-helix domain-containing protein n=1 Tax=Janthinobacterium sp. TaxID=1871054 RepID=UPI00289786E1|nr:helix-turn-helix transcriptional regulator [Janthinobacterium sp.]
MRQHGTSLQAGGSGAMQRLTPAERAVAAMAMQGTPYKLIARSLDKSPATVRNQLHMIYQKLGVSNRTALIFALHADA